MQTYNARVTRTQLHQSIALSLSNVHFVLSPEMVLVDDLDCILLPCVDTLRVHDLQGNSESPRVKSKTNTNRRVRPLTQLLPKLEVVRTDSNPTTAIHRRIT